jgi:hypothetical protein
MSQVPTGSFAVPDPGSWQRLAVLRVEVAASAGPAVARLDAAARIGRQLSTLRSTIPAEGLRYLAYTFRGLVAVYDDPEAALRAARSLRRRRPDSGTRVRYALYWGDVYVGADGAPLGGEPELLGRVLELTAADSAGDDHCLPDRDRVVVLYGTVAQLPEKLRAQFVALGPYSVAGYANPLELWTESLEAFLGREPTASERLFGVAGLYPDTVLDIWWERRLRNVDRAAS